MTDWGPLKKNGNFLQHMRHENGLIPKINHSYCFNILTDLLQIIDLQGVRIFD